MAVQQCRRSECHVQVWGEGYRYKAVSSRWSEGREAEDAGMSTRLNKR
jgi:hypothetical protein